MKSVTIETWRRRAVAAEGRAETAERALKRARSSVARLREDVVGCDDVVAQCDLQRRVLRRLATHHLGGQPTEAEITQVIIVWMTEDHRRKPREDIEAMRRLMNETTRRMMGLSDDDE